MYQRVTSPPRSQLLLAHDQTNLFSRNMLAPETIQRSRVILQHANIDWPTLGYDDDTIDGLVEFLLRIIQSMVIAPPVPPRTGPELRAYLRRWIGAAVNA